MADEWKVYKEILPKNYMSKSHWPGLKCRLWLYITMLPVIPQPSYCTLFKANLIFLVTADPQNEHLNIIHVERHSTIRWKIPCFPVLVIEFAKVHYKQGTETKDGFVQKTMASELKQGEYLCTSHCEIEIEGKSYKVLWEIKPDDAAVTILSNPQSAANDVVSDLDDECNEDDESDESEETCEACVSTSHCLPFKVMGTCYTAERQKALEESYEYLYEHNRPLFVKLKAEPDNPYDRNAIAVYIMASSEYKRVGYLAHELTQFLHPLLNDPSLEVSVNKIRFCTTFLMIGFYLTINITRKGLWEKAVVKASCKVK